MCRLAAWVTPVLLALTGLVSPASQASTGRPVGRVVLTATSHRMFTAATYDITIPDGLGLALSAGDTMTLTAPVGTEFFNASILFSVFDPETGQWVPGSYVDVHPTGDDFTANEAVFTLSAPVAADIPVHVRIQGVGNPGPGRRLRWYVSTSAQPQPAASGAFSVTGRGRTEWGRFTSDAGTRTYLLYRAPGRAHGRPLLVDLHGCTETAATEARWSRLTQYAAKRHIDVLFPQQPTSANGGHCWNWFLPDSWDRSGQEPSLIAGMTRTVARRLHSDRSRVYVSGISAGGIMSDLMAVTYPDLYAAAVIYAGCEYEGLPCFEGPSAQPPQAAALLAAQQMAGRLRAVPVMVIHGDVDEVVPVQNALATSQMWVGIDALAAGSPLPVGDVAPTRSYIVAPPGRQRSLVNDWILHGRVMVRLWIVNGMAHQWSGAADGGTPEDPAITDPAGPNLTPRILNFLLNHHKGRRSEWAGQITGS